MIGNNPHTAARFLSEGALVAIPTETVYGLGANALNEDAVLRIFKAKNRPSFDPLIVHCRNLDHVMQFVESIPEPLRKLGETFWPGPLTLILPKTNQVPDIVSSGLPNAGFRVPGHPLTRELLETIDFPLAAPSANPFGYVSPTTASHVQDQLGDRIAYILDGGQSSVGLESTIVAMEGNQVAILRFGGIPVESIEQIVGPVLFRAASSANPLSPGQLDHHYAPDSTFIVCLNIEEALGMASSYRRCGLISFGTISDSVPPTVVGYEVLSPLNQLDEAAKNLFGAIRTLDKMHLDAIIAVKVPDTGLGRAINDRLRRAAHT